MYIFYIYFILLLIDSNLINEIDNIIPIFQKCIENENEELANNILKIIFNIISNSIY